MKHGELKIELVNKFSDDRKSYPKSKIFINMILNKVIQ